MDSVTSRVYITSVLTPADPLPFLHCEIGSDQVGCVHRRRTSSSSTSSDGRATTLRELSFTRKERRPRTRPAGTSLEDIRAYTLVKEHLRSPVYSSPNFFFFLFSFLLFFVPFSFFLLGGHDPRVAFGLSGGVVCSLDLVESGTRESGCQSRLIIGTL